MSDQPPTTGQRDPSLDELPPPNPDIDVRVDLATPTRPDSSGDDGSSLTIDLRTNPQGPPRTEDFGGEPTSAAPLFDLPKAPQKPPRRRFLSARRRDARSATPNPATPNPATPNRATPKRATPNAERLTEPEPSEVKPPRTRASIPKLPIPKPSRSKPAIAKPTVAKPTIARASRSKRTGAAGASPPNDNQPGTAEAATPNSAADDSLVMIAELTEFLRGLRWDARRSGDADDRAVAEEVMPVLAVEKGEPSAPQTEVSRDGGSDDGSDDGVGDIDSEELEARLAQRLAGGRFAGDAEPERDRDAIGASVAALLGTGGLDHLAETAPATFVLCVVDAATGHSAGEFDEAVAFPELTLGSELNDRFSRALVTLGLTAFEEYEHRDHSDPRTRHFHRIQLHTGIGPRQIDAILDAIAASYWAGASTGREVIADWLISQRWTESAIGEHAYRLLTATVAGEELLAALFDVIRQPDDEQPPTRSCLAGLAPRLAEAVAAWVADYTAPGTEWGVALRPQLRVEAVGPGEPSLVLPQNQLRWHLNGQLLGYGSPAHLKSVPLPNLGVRHWSIAVSATRPRSPVDIRISSAASDRVVLVFDERHRYHPHRLPISGDTATVIAPLADHVVGEIERRNLSGSWEGYARITVDLRRVDKVEVSSRGAMTVEITLDQRLRASLVGARAGQASGPAGEVVFTGAPYVAFDGHRPPVDSLSIEVADASSNQVAGLPARRLDTHRDRFDLGELFGPTPSRATVTVRRDGYEPLRFQLVYLGGVDLEELPPQRLDMVCEVPIRVADGYSVAPPLPQFGPGDYTSSILIAGPQGSIVPLLLTIPRDDEVVIDLTGAGPPKPPAPRAKSPSPPPEDQRLVALWRSDPGTASIDDRCGLDQPGLSDSIRRWRVFTGWEPPSASGDVDRALAGLVEPLLHGLNVPLGKLDPSTLALSRQVGFPALVAPAWSIGLHHEFSELSSWAETHHSQVDGWRDEYPGLRHLQPLWAAAPPAQRSTVLLSVVTAGVLASIDGPRRAEATDRLIEALQTMPRLGQSAAVFGAAYGWVVDNFPTTRFVQLDLPVN